MPCCGELLNYRRGKLGRERVYPPERDVSGGGTQDRGGRLPLRRQYRPGGRHPFRGRIRLHPGECRPAPATTSSPAPRKMPSRSADAIKEKGLNRVVLAACTPRTHEPLFRDTCREAGINPYFFEMANIREHCSWVHSKDKENRHRKGQGHRPDVGGPGRPSGAAAGI